MKKVFKIDGANFSDFEGFCEEFSKKVLLGKYTWNGNLDAFNDILFGGFGDIEDSEEYTIIWKNSNKSRKDLDYAETIRQLNKRLKSCHSSNIPIVREDIKQAENNKGTTVFDWLVEIIEDNTNVILIFE